MHARTHTFTLTHISPPDPHPLALTPSPSPPRPLALALRNSPGFPLWCLNKESGNTRAPISDSNGQQQCVDWDKYNADQVAAPSIYSAILPSIQRSPLHTTAVPSITTALPSITTVQENFDWSTEYYEMYPDINPDLNCARHPPHPPTHALARRAAGHAGALLAALKPPSAMHGGLRTLTLTMHTAPSQGRVGTART